MKAGCHPVAIAQVVEHWQLKSEALSSIPARWLPVFHSSLNIEACADSTKKGGGGLLHVHVCVYIIRLHVPVHVCVQ